jgi:TPR repeat protein
MHCRAKFPASVAFTVALALVGAGGCGVGALGALAGAAVGAIPNTSRKAAADNRRAVRAEKEERSRWAAAEAARGRGDLTKAKSTASFACATGGDCVAAADDYSVRCEGGEMSACRRLGAMYFSGRGVTLDVSHACTLYERACASADDEACRALSSMRACDADSAAPPGKTP